MIWQTPRRSLRPAFRCFSTSTKASRTSLNILFFGRESFSCEAFKILHATKDVWASLSVATTPDQMIGRRRKELSVSPLKVLAQSLNVPVFEIPPDKDDFASWKPNFGESDGSSNSLITASFGRAIPPTVLDFAAPSLRLNIHPSMLPAYRGAAPIQRTIINGTTDTGVSILQMEDVSVNGFDAGPVWDQRKVTIPPRPLYKDLEMMLAREGGQLLVDHFRRRLGGDEVLPILQDHSKATRARMITAETARVKWDKWDASKVDRVHRAIGHQRPLHTTLPSGQGVKLLAVDLIATGIPENLQHPGDATYDPQTRSLIVKCAGQTFIAVTRLQTENRREAVAHEWWNGVKADLQPSRTLHLGHGVGTKQE